MARAARVWGFTAAVIMSYLWPLCCPFADFYGRLREELHPVPPLVFPVAVCNLDRSFCFRSSPLAFGLPLAFGASLLPFGDCARRGFAPRATA